MITLLPLMLALLALDDSAVSALSPARWLHTLAGLHGHYLAWLATLALSVSALTVLANQLGFFLCLLLGILLTLMVATSLGGLLYQCRDGIGLEAWVTPERGHLLALQEENRARENLIHELYGSLRAKNIESAWNSALQWLTQRGLKPQDMVWLRSRVQDWKDPRLSERLTAELIAYYLRVGNTDAALADVESWLDTGRRYHATHARDLGRLIGLSRLDGRHALANRLLDECTQPHAEHEEIKNLLKHRTSQT